MVERRRNAIYLIIILMLLSGLITGRSIFFNVAYAFGGFLLLSFIWAWGSANWLRINRQTRARRAQVGRYMEERFSVSNTSLLPRLWLEVYDESTLPGHQASYVVSGLKPRGTEHWQVRTLCIRRGEFLLGPLRVVSGDPFGLFETERRIESTSRLIVYPPLINLTEFDMPVGILPGGDALRRRTHHVTANAAGVRDYVTGDSFSRIHWRTTARKSRLMVKEFELDPLSDIWIVLDSEQLVHVGNYAPDAFDDELYSEMRRQRSWIPPTTEEYGVTIAGSLAAYFLRKDRGVGFITHGQRREVLQVDRGARQLTRIMETLAVVRAHGQAKLEHLLLFESDHIPRGSTVIVITPSTRDEWIASAHRLARQGLRIVSILIDGATFGGPPGIHDIAGQLSGVNVPGYVVQNGSDLPLTFSRTHF